MHHFKNTPAVKKGLQNHLDSGKMLRGYYT